MQSGLHFGLNLALIALLPARDYGSFAFTLVLGGVGLTYVRSLTAMPASTYIGRARSEAFAHFYEGAFGAAALTLCAVMAAISGAVIAIWSPDAAFSGAAVVGLWSLRSHLRTIGFARRRAGAVTISDAVFATTGVAASAAALHFAQDLLQGVLYALALANVAGAAALSLARRAPPLFDFGRRARWFYFLLARRLAWSLYSVSATILHGQGVAFLVVAYAGPAAFAPIAAMLAFFAPLRIFGLSLANMLQPEISRLVARGDEAGWRATRNAWTFRACLLTALYGYLGFVAIPHLHLRSIENHQPVLFIAALAWALYAVVLAYLLPRILLEARMRFREIAVLTTFGATVTFVVTCALLKTAPPAYAIVGAVLGESVVAAATWKLSMQRFSARRGAANIRFSRGAAPPPPDATYNAGPTP
ncbi:MAG: hypothetical protein KGM15_11370 [Pseudomonadota bacterium]|nr:hypothetical protein [Pseudomonadota bacterium]